MDFLPLKRKLLDRSVIFHCHSKMASCATRETPAHEHFPLSNPVQSQHKNATYGPPSLPGWPITAAVEPCITHTSLFKFESEPQEGFQIPEILKSVKVQYQEENIK